MEVVIFGNLMKERMATFVYVIFEVEDGLTSESLSGEGAVDCLELLVVLF